MASLNEVPLTQLKGVGEKFALTLSKLDLHSVQDLIFHLPFRYEDRTRIVPLSQIRVGQHVLFEAEVKGSRVVIGRRKSLEVHVRDSSGQVALRFYHFSAAQAKQLSNGSRVRCYGEARLGQTGLEFYHPEYQVLKPGDKHSPPEKLTPIYTLTEGVQQPRLRKLCASALGYLDRHQVTELIPGSILKDLQLPSLQEAVRYLHAPPTDADQHALLEG
ncbi:OB-fold nucleic acid binding domain-containing protein, partial [Oleiphilus sp. HI0066]|uniref:OB-fold nucleic acid binding domain-containing protein n=3 Tax=unclassified Oleiphilus TaxID=2631174 RepID=UPI000B009278